ncbi:enoyl-CoA hydratase/isomerase family protein [Membranicola marinus]|uniref:Enoyl-CoA hydratase/isomerase family protein n=1 Tax=Membranihabitans marinus TaxID=1227546 RepID=A0A953HWY3_9BACT|nr:enoyl-CoA hydratase-related protein [Membranihabitans marinus]MBY5958111.1 enoyl-CoA hydratase/isomerase family protein [Membranihabitans marinus]
MSLIRYHEEQAVATLTLNRPESLHSLTGELMSQLMESLHKAGQNPDIRCIVLTATGKAFCAGQDLNEFDRVDEIDFEGTLKSRYEPLIQTMRSLSKPIVCGLNGVAAGAGASLALACDMIIASEDAYLTMAFVHIGLIPDGGSTWFLPRMTGYHRAMNLMMTGDKVTARQAHEWGWIYAVYPPDGFDDALHVMATKMSHMPTQALARIKQAVNASFQNTLEEQLMLERNLQTQAGKTKDFKEGVAAFREKRRPKFGGG